MRYKTVNNLLGWIAFAIAAFVYCSTIPDALIPLPLK